MEPGTDGLDLRDLGASLRRGRLWVAVGGVLGLLAGFAVVSLVPSRYQASTSVLIRGESSGPQGMLSQVSGVVLGGLGGLGGSTLDTEVAILQSRAVIGAVVDSLGLQVEVRQPAETATASLFASVDAEPRVEEGEYRFEREGDAYRVEGPAGETRWAPGAPVQLPGASLTPRGGELPEEFTVVLMDREAAIDRVADGLQVSTDQGDVVALQYRAGDPATAAAVPNLMMSHYLERRRTTDRGVNQHRYEFLAAHVDTLSHELAQAEAALRVHQESTGMMNPQVTGQAEAERAMAVRASLEEADVEARALLEIVRQGERGGLEARELAAYPSLIRNPAVTNVLSQLMELEAGRAALLGRRTANDPEVQTIDSTIARLEEQLLRLSSDYLAGLNRQRAELAREMSGYRSVLASLPAQAEQSFRLQREVERLSQTLLVLQSQVVQARLDAISEGGDVRQIDPAVEPKRPVFPNRPLTLFGGLTGGLFFGVAAAVATGRRKRYLTEPWEVAAAAGLPVIEFNPRLPLSFGELGSGRTLLLVPVGGGASVTRVGEQIARTAALQGRHPVLADLRATTPRAGSGVPVPVPALLEPGEAPERGVALTVTRDGYACYPASAPASPSSPRAVLDTLEERFQTVIAVAGGLDAPETVSVLDPGRPTVLVARAGQLAPRALADAVALCRRMGLRVLGVVLLPVREPDAAAE